MFGKYTFTQWVLETSCLGIQVLKAVDPKGQTLTDNITKEEVFEPLDNGSQSGLDKNILLVAEMDSFMFPNSELKAEIAKGKVY